MLQFLRHEVQFILIALFWVVGAIYGGILIYAVLPLTVFLFYRQEAFTDMLFGFLLAGWLLLSASLVSGWLFLDDLFAQHLVHKTLLSASAWVIFGLLLLGRHQLGWRGYKAIRWTLAGFCLLMLAYFGSKLVREFILHV